MGMGRKPAPNRGCIATRGHRITLTLCQEITKSQKPEIAQMETILARQR